MVRVVDNRVNSVTRVNNAVDSGFMMAVVEVMVADAHMDGVRVNDGDIVMEEVIQLMMERTGVKVRTAERTMMRMAEKEKPHFTCERDLCSR